jgi:hypothetical protein
MSSEIPAHLLVITLAQFQNNDTKPIKARNHTLHLATANPAAPISNIAEVRLLKFFHDGHHTELRSGLQKFIR